MDRTGLRDWMLQRFSAIVLLVYSLMMVVFFALNPSISYSVWSEFFDNNLVKLLSFLTILALSIHAWVGLWTVFTDYVKLSWLRLLLQGLVIVALLSLIAWSYPIWRL